MRSRRTKMEVVPHASRYIRVEDGAVRRITSGRPDIQNAMTSDTARELVDALGDLNPKEHDAAVITGEGDVLSAGGDIKAMIYAMRRHRRLTEDRRNSCSPATSSTVSGRQRWTLSRKRVRATSWTTGLNSPWRGSRIARRRTSASRRRRFTTTSGQLWWDGLACEARLQSVSYDTPAHEEGIDAFLNGRQLNFE